MKITSILFLAFFTFFAENQAQPKFSRLNKKDSHLHRNEPILAQAVELSIH